MKTFLILISLVACSTSFAQMANNSKLTDVVYGFRDRPNSQVLTYASYPGGEAAFRQYLADHIDYPTIARDYGVEGTVKVEFRVGPDGRADMVRVIDGPGYGCEKEAERLIRSMPRWQPALQNGLATTSRKRIIAIEFRLN